MLHIQAVHTAVHLAGGSVPGGAPHRLQLQGHRFARLEAEVRCCRRAVAQGLDLRTRFMLLPHEFSLPGAPQRLQMVRQCGIEVRGLLPIPAFAPVFASASKFAWLVLL